jgi:tetratricopeptide (TPR) repeat protein
MGFLRPTSPPALAGLEEGHRFLGPSRRPHPACNLGSMPHRRAPGRILRLLGQLRDRPLGRVLAVYALSAWFTLLALQVFLATTALPAWLPDLFLALVLLGLPPILAIGVLEERSGRERGASTQDEATSTLVEAPEGDTPRSSSWVWRSTGVALVVLALGGAWWALGRPGFRLSNEGVLSIAVLTPPLEAEGGRMRVHGDLADPTWALVEDLRLKLAVYPGLRTYEVSREASPQAQGDFSVAEWEASIRPQVQRALAEGAGRVVAVRWRGASMGTEAALEALFFDHRGRRQWTLEVPSVGADGTLQVEAFQADLTDTIRDDLGMEARPSRTAGITDDPATFLSFSRGIYWRRLGSLHRGADLGEADAAWAQAEQAFVEAAESDPGFSPASSRRSEVILLRAAVHRGLSEIASNGSEGNGWVRQARRAVERALQIDASDAYARKVLGDLHGFAAGVQEGERDDSGFLPTPNRALHEYAMVARQLPGWSQVHRDWGSAARTLGAWEAADLAWTRVLELEPADAEAHMEAGVTDHLRRLHGRAIIRLERALALDPSLDSARSALFEARLAHWGDLDSARVVLRPSSEGPNTVGPPGLRYRAHLYARDFGSAQQVAAEGGWRGEVDGCTGYSPAQMTGTIRGFLGQLEGSIAEWNRARSEWVTALEQESVDPAATKGALAEAYAWMGDSPSALRFAHEAVRETRWEVDAVKAAACWGALAKVHLLTGNAREAVDLLVWLLSRPGPLHRGEIWFDPIWEQIRTDPRLQPWVTPPPWGAEPSSEGPPA